MSAVAEIPAGSLAPIAEPSPFVQRLSKLDRTQRMRLGAGIALLVLVVILGLVMGRQADYRTLYANLTDKDGGAIVAQLSQMNVPYKYSEGGGAILVPSDRVHDVRLRLASLGLPKGQVTGFELMENNRFGMTQFQERLTFQRGLEGELTRSIQALSSVASARVHLALPNQNGFFREQQKPSASVLLSLHGGRVLDRTQLAGIVHLVASSVPEMSPSAVSVLDDTGKLLSGAPEGSANGADAQQLQYVSLIEQQYTRRIMDILEPIVGRNNVKAQVTADVDFTQTEQTSEQHRPNLASDASAVRSQQVVETTNGPTPGQPSGIPGAVSNQPPQQANAPINGASAPLTASGQAAAGQQGGAKRESVTNYEVDKTVRTVRGGAGGIKRLSAAVVVNHQTSKDDKGNPTTRALTPEQITQMTALVRETIGFNQERGDSVNLMNAVFVQDAAVDDTTPLWRQPATLETARSLAWPVGTLLLALIVMFGLVRPGMKAMMAPKALAGGAGAGGAAGGAGGAGAAGAAGAGGLAGAAGGAGGAGGAGAQLNALVGDDAQRPALPGPDGTAVALTPTDHQLRLEAARKLALENPIAVANIVKDWINGENGAPT
ncbi:flagellar basal-body MS-ring/collar protein FliF [Pseudorhodoferax sp. Leaf267]|uniref:flagellar basal-body MS-ring/collar protein FliF n=1 Tax=Pseudorhodoferax sp. Leaf267 TaxID=1736316 RepID=UPI000700F546|nr:flagellar basal-body MS-ring/collar protein FliF [Pseudorhodoferax sp. Leaf267]KQP13782.1 flagellar M-ring protein FliF [Pseudorhodoferax sp. Leaf267]